MRQWDPRRSGPFFVVLRMFSFFRRVRGNLRLGDGCPMSASRRQRACNATIYSGCPMGWRSGARARPATFPRTAPAIVTAV